MLNSLIYCFLSQGKLPAAPAGTGGEDRVESEEARSRARELWKQEDAVDQTAPQGNQQQPAEGQPAGVLSPGCHRQPHHLPVIRAACPRGGLPQRLSQFVWTAGQTDVRNTSASASITVLHTPSFPLPPNIVFWCEFVLMLKDISFTVVDWSFIMTLFNLLFM